jgi:hypothetical protein
MTEKRKFIKDIRPGRGELDVNDALRLAVEDERFSRALLSDPQKFAPAFNLREIEIAAINEAVGGIVKDGGLKEWYE